MPSNFVQQQERKYGCMFDYFPMVNSDVDIVLVCIYIHISIIIVEILYVYRSLHLISTYSKITLSVICG